MHLCSKNTLVSKLMICTAKHFKTFNYNPMPWRPSCFVVITMFSVALSQERADIMCNKLQTMPLWWYYALICIYDIKHGYSTGSVPRWDHELLLACPVRLDTMPGKAVHDLSLVVVNQCKPSSIDLSVKNDWAQQFKTPRLIQTCPWWFILCSTTYSLLQKPDKCQPAGSKAVGAAALIARCSLDST